MANNTTLHTRQLPIRRQLRPRGGSNQRVTGTALFNEINFERPAPGKRGRQQFKLVLLNIFEGNLSTSTACFQKDDLLDTDSLKQIMFSVFLHSTPLHLPLLLLSPLFYSFTINGSHIEHIWLPVVQLSLTGGNIHDIKLTWHRHGPTGREAGYGQ